MWAWWSLETREVVNMNKQPEDVPEEKVPKPRGYTRDIVIKKMPDGSEKVLEDTGWKENKIVIGTPKLMAGLWLNEPTFTGGILFHAQGEGDPSWDMLSPVPEADWIDDKLEAEYFRKAPDSIVYLDESNNPVAYITGRILVTTTLDFLEANGPSGTGISIREHGLFGGDATSSLDSGQMADAIRHKAKWKDPSTKLIRYIRFIF